MSKANELKTRVIDRMKERGIKGYEPHGEFRKFLAVGEKYAQVFETGRHNGTEENVTVTIEIMKRLTEYSSRRLFKVRVPKDASEKVIDRRLDEVERLLND